MLMVRYIIENYIYVIVVPDWLHSTD